MKPCTMKDGEGELQRRKKVCGPRCGVGEGRGWGVVEKEGMLYSALVRAINPTSRDDVAPLAHGQEIGLLRLGWVVHDNLGLPKIGVDSLGYIHADEFFSIQGKNGPQYRSDLVGK